jgi:diguanylate cyclase (GGDEF)-like protein
MTLGLDYLRRLVGTEIRSERDLAGYVIRITAICVAIALAVDVAAQMTSFISWPVAIRSWLITAVEATLIAAIASRAIGKAHLRLYRAKVIVDELSHTDPLTGLANRRALFAAAEAWGTACMVLVIVDIDRFKAVNDTHGHIAGDMVLKTIGHIMQTDLAELGRVGRLGGEEFAIIVSAFNPATVIERLEAFRGRLAATPFVAGDLAVRVTISAGVALRRPGGSFTQLYADADQALYKAKAAGRNRIVVSEAMHAFLNADADVARWTADHDPPRRRAGDGLTAA